MEPRPEHLSETEITELARQMEVLRAKLLRTGLSDQEDQEYTTLIGRWGSYPDLRSKSWRKTVGEANKAHD